MFRLQESREKGMVMVATADALPGATLFAEVEPLLDLPEKEKQKYSDYRNGIWDAVCLAVYERYCLLNNTQQEEFRALYASNDSDRERRLHSAAQATIAVGKSVDIKLFVEIGAIWRTNSFNNRSAQLSAVYKVASRISHSCAPNAHIFFSGRELICRSIRPIQSGEEITISYTIANYTDSALQRRQRLLQSSWAFLCQCSRCTAPVDDSRQFLCEGILCSGTHMAANYSTRNGDKLARVWAEELQLLPCQNCQREAPTDNSAKCAAQEARLWDIVEQLQEGALGAITGQSSKQHCLDTLRALEDVPYQPHHALYGPVLQARFHATEQLVALHAVADKNLVEAARAYATWLDHIYPYPSLQMVAERAEVIQAAVPHVKARDDRDALLNFTLGTLRMVLILVGRANGGRAQLDAALRTLGWAPGPPHDLRRCAYCEEAPDRAVLTLRLCGRCRQAAYCSTGCQQAHWKTHCIHCVAELEKEGGVDEVPPRKGSPCCQG